MDRYQRVKKIGEGAFGKAVLVRHKQTNRQCVVKEINIMKMAAKEREDARKEVSVLGQLKHPNIVTYIESFEEAGTLYIVMNYCSGGDLYAKINSQHGRLFTEDQVLNWFVQICLALKHIHDRKILHRDIKSQNIFLTSTGTVQLGDFGIAKVLNNTVELARTCIGTPYYLSPEIVENKPYNNKSDIWSLGCVLYELTTLKHAFEAGNMKNLVLKIIRGSYPPIPPQYSYDLRGLVAQLFKRAPRDRPSINSVLKKNFVMERVRRLLSAEEIADEFSHTVMHGARLAKALPPAPRPSSAPKQAGNPPRPGSAGRGRYNPANVYGVPVGRKSQNRSSSDLKKKAGSGGAAGGVNRPVPIPGQQDWLQKKKDMVDREQKRREENRKKYEEQVARRHQNLVEKQKLDRINKAREDGWKQLINSSDEKEPAKPQTPVGGGGGEARPLPMPRQFPEPVQPNFVQNRGPREAGNYDHYLAYLDKLKMQRQDREKEMNQRRPADYMPAPRPLLNPPDNPPAVQAAQAINQANYDRKLGGEAAERAKIVEDYMQRRQAAAANKARGLADLHGGRPPSGRGRRTPDPAQRPGAAKPPVAAVRNKEEQEYLEKLRQIREQNMRERRNLIQQRAGIPSPVSAEERKKKADALKQQAEDWAKKKKDQLEKERQQLLKQQQDKIKQQQGSRPNSARANMTPAPAVPVSGVLHLIGANPKAAASADQEITPIDEESSANVQQKKSEILKRLNDKTPGRGKWGGDNGPVAPAAEVAVEEEEKVQLRRPWGGGGVSPLAEPESARSQWGDEQFRLSDLPLEQTGSAMEATSARDQVVKNPSENPKSARNQWGRPGSTVVKALNQLPISEGTVTLDSENQQEDKESMKPPVTTKPAIGFTISLSDSPAPTPAPTPTPASQPTPIPSVKPPIRSGTIVLSSVESKQASEPPAEPTSSAPVASAESLGVVGGKEEAPVVVADSESSQTVFRKASEPAAISATPASPATTLSSKGKLKISERSDSVQKGLSTGNFDMKNVQMLRTCSEPDLTSLFRELDKQLQTKSTLTRHQSLDLTPEDEQQDDVSASQDESPNSSNSEEEEKLSSLPVEKEEGKKNDIEVEEDVDEEDDEDDEDLISMRETMQSLLLDNDDDDEDEGALSPKIDFSLSSDVETTLKEAAVKERDDKTGGEDDTNVSDQEDNDDDDKEDESASETVREKLPLRAQSDSLLDQKHKTEEGNQEDAGAAGEEGDDEEDDEERLLYNTADILTLTDSDEETVFGDDDDDLDLFSRLEQQREQLESELGFEKFIEIYKTVQALQEDEDENMEEGARIAISMLGPAKQHLYPRIFQLVMADTAFTEDNA